MPSKAGTHHSSEKWKPPLFLGEVLKLWPLYMLKRNFRPKRPIFTEKQGDSSLNWPFIKTQNFKIGKHTLLCKSRPYNVKSQGCLGKNTPFLVHRLHGQMKCLKKDPFYHEIQNDDIYPSCQTMTLLEKNHTDYKTCGSIHIISTWSES